MTAKKILVVDAGIAPSLVVAVVGDVAAAMTLKQNYLDANPARVARDVLLAECIDEPTHDKKK
jgi:hypothetical protein